jgi:uncharacterized protein (TIRG00374 family)
MNPVTGKSNKNGLNFSLIIRLGVTVPILAYLGAKLHWVELGTQLMNSNPFWLLVACLLLGIGFFLASVRWWLLLKVQEIAVPLRVAASLTLIGQFFNSFFLGTTGGDVVKLIYIMKYAPDQKARATLSIIMDRAIGMFVLLVCALVALPWQLPILMRREETAAIAYALLILFVVVLGIALGLALVPFHRLPSFLHRFWEKIPGCDILESLIAGFRKHGRSKQLTLEAMACGLAIWFIVFTSGFFIARAIHLEVGYFQILVILSIVICVISLPISLGGHGVREGIFVLMFTVFGIISIDPQSGVGQEPAILFSILYFALFLVWSLVGGLIYLGFSVPVNHRSLSSQVESLAGETEKIV